jgi:hypothetical protein
MGILSDFGLTALAAANKAMPEPRSEPPLDDSRPGAGRRPCGGEIFHYQDLPHKTGLKSSNF